MRRRLHLPSPAMVVALLALLTALTSSAYAAVVLPRNSVGTIHLKNAAVTPVKLKNGAVTAAKLRKGAVASPKVLNGSLLAEDFKPGQLPAGPKGDKGDQGPPGLGELQVLTAETATNSDGTKSQVVHCPAGKKATGGGGSTGGAGAPMVAVSGGPFGDTGWSVIAREIVATAGTWVLKAHVVCAKTS